MSVILHCPICQAKPNGVNHTCQQCGADLSLLVQLDHLALRHYDEALLLAKKPGDLQAPIEKLLIALSLDPEHFDSYLVLGKLRAQQGDYQEAIRLWRRALEIAPGNTAASAKALAAIKKAEQLLARQREEQLAKDEEQAAAEKGWQKRRRMVIGVFAAGAFMLGTLLVGFPLVVYPKLTAEDPSSRVSRSLQRHPALSHTSLRVSTRGQQVVIEGELPSVLHKDLVLALAQSSAAPHTLDISRLQVRPLQLAADLQRAISSLPSVLDNKMPAGQGRDLVAALSTARITVTPMSENQLRLTGTVATPEAKKVIEELAASLAGRDHIDSSEVQVFDDYMTYTVKTGDTPQIIARRLCGDSRQWKDIRRFSPENARVLRHPARLHAGAEIKVPKRLLATSYRSR